MTRIEYAIFHLELAERWLAVCDIELRSTRKLILEHHIYMARFHIDKAHMEKAKKEDVE